MKQNSPKYQCKQTNYKEENRIQIVTSKLSHRVNYNINYYFTYMCKVKMKFQYYLVWTNTQDKYTTIRELKKISK